MKFQTPKNDPINRGDEGRLEIKNEIIATWLERMVVVQTLPGVDDEQELQQTIREIQELLNEEESAR